MSMVPQRKRIALVAHDNKKLDMVAWAKFNKKTLSAHRLFATGTTGKMLQDDVGLEVTRLLSGPLGGDLQLGTKIAEHELDMMIFFWDPLEPQPHDVDVRALLRIGVVWNIPMASNRATADFLISSTLMDLPYDRIVPLYGDVKVPGKLSG
ncbi:MAG: methylglyoxal synthase [Deltaproteobacteria bacterium]|nr:methylglyoxal synthase [bacterium]MCB9475733.1 methylglyoxal synthase [Deltaproteobacteria bacterium]MCB9479255.1 methylglyoxal synthase [Deltaproteobacteria bacterium]MCB9490135.1 methylglyoxal synthase [Deltaproteobacteria bacterium]